MSEKQTYPWDDLDEQKPVDSAGCLWGEQNPMSDARGLHSRRRRLPMGGYGQTIPWT